MKYLLPPPSYLYVLFWAVVLAAFVADNVEFVVGVLIVGWIAAAVLHASEQIHGEDA